MPKPRPSLAIIGSGISGISAAFILDSLYDVTLIEANPTLGGHTNTVSVSDATLGTCPIDTGFIVFNLKNYPQFTTFLRRLGVAYHASDMSFGFYDSARPFWYCSDIPWGLFSQKRHLFSPRFYQFLTHIRAFNHRVCVDLDHGRIDPSMSLNAYLNTLPFCSSLVSDYIIPMGAAIWSCPIDQIYQFPAHAFFSFWQNHCLLTLKSRPLWQTIIGGSIQYIEAFKRQFSGTIRCNSPVTSVSSNQSGVTITFADHTNLQSDKVIIATHADQALDLLHSPTPDQRKLLSAWRYSKNTVYLHTDARVMPPSRSGWSSWLVQQSADPTHPLHMTYYMNRLQRLDTPTDYFVTLNNSTLIDDQCLLKTIHYTHPIYDLTSLNTQAELYKMQSDPIYFCGSYFGYGFHEDGIRSAISIATQLGACW